MPERPLRVTLLDPNANSPPYDRALGRALAAAGCRVELVTSPFLYEALPPARGYRVRHAFFHLAAGQLGRRAHLAERPLARRLLKSLEYPLDWAALLARLRHHPPDVLHIQWSARPSLDERLWRWLRRREVPVVYTAHNLLPHATAPDDEARYRRLYHAADRLIVHSQDGARALVDRFGVPPSSVAVVPHGPLLEDQPELSREEARRRLGLPPDAPLVLFAGLIEPYKGLADLIDAFAELIRCADDARLAADDRRQSSRLVVAGRPNEPFAPYRAALARHSLLGRVHLDLRFLPEPDLAAYLCAADVVALPYRDASTSGLLHAARRFGRPVVASAVGDLAELVADGKSGLLVPPSDPPALAAALARLLADPPLAARLGESGRKRAREQSWDVAARSTIEVYRRTGGATP